MLRWTFLNCTKGKCIHGSTAKSAIGTLEAEFWKLKGTYKFIDTMICCSEFMKSKLDSNPLFAKKTVTMHNFIDTVEWKDTEKKIMYYILEDSLKKKELEHLFRCVRNFQMYSLFLQELGH